MQENTYTGGVSKPDKIPWWTLGLASAVVLGDEILKRVALARLPEEGTVELNGFIDFAIHKNYGIAFDIPFKIPIIILVSIFIGVALLRVIHQTYRTNQNIAICASLIIVGALGNLFDRLYFGFVVDYIILFRRSAINISDIIILLGVFGLLWASRRSKKHDHTIDKHT